MIIPIGQPFKRGQVLYVYTKDAEGKVHSRRDVGVFFIPMTGAMMSRPRPDRGRHPRGRHGPRAARRRARRSAGARCGIAGRGRACRAGPGGDRDGAGSAVTVGAPAGRAVEGRKQFFFEKKNQKTFVPGGGAWTTFGAEGAKSFCFFFFRKRRRLLSSCPVDPMRLTRRALGLGAMALAAPARAARTLSLGHAFPAGGEDEGDFRDRLSRRFAAEVLRARPARWWCRSMPAPSSRGRRRSSRR